MNIYQTPALKIIRFEEEDVITASGGGGSSLNVGIGDVPGESFNDILDSLK